MPCDRIITCSVDLKVSDRTTLLDALKAAGFTEITENGMEISAYHNATSQWVSLNGSTINLRQGTEYLSDTVKQHYGKKTVLKQAKRYGWKVKEDKHNPFKLTVTR